MIRRGISLMVLGLCFLTTVAWAVGQMLTVQVREAQVRPSPSFVNAPSKSISYGQQVSVLEERDAWVLVSSATGVKGWLHRSALSDKPVLLSSGSENVPTKAGDREVSAAGKGFTRQVEQQYRVNHPGGYAQLEAMERISYQPQELLRFLAAGQVTPGQGVGR